MNLCAATLVHRAVRLLHVSALALPFAALTLLAAPRPAAAESPDAGVAAVSTTATVEATATVSAPPPPALAANANVSVQVDARAAAGAVARAAVRAVPVVPVRLRGAIAFGGLGVDDMRVLGPHLALSGGVDADLASFFALGARADYLVAGAPGDARPLRANYFGGSAIFRAWTDRPRREGFSLELGAGYLRVADDFAPSGAVLEVALARLASAHDGAKGQGLGGALVLRGQHGVGATSGYRALTLGLEADLDLNLPGEGGADPAPAAIRHVFGVEGLLGGAPAADGARDPGRFSGGFGMWAGFPLGAVVEPQIRLDAVRSAGGEGLDPRYGYGAAGGLRVRFDPWAPIYLEAHGGYAWLTERDHGAYADVGAGLRYTPCKDDAHWALLVGARGRLGFGEAAGLTGLYGTLGVEYVGGPAYARPRCVEAPPVVAAEGGAEVRVEVPAPRVDVSATVDAGASVGVQNPNPTPTQNPIQTPTQTPVRTPPVARTPPPAEESEVPSEPVPFPMRIGLEGTFGWLDAAQPVSGVAGGLALHLDMQITHWLALGARLGYVARPDGATDANLDAIDDLNTQDFRALQATAGPRFTAWTDEASREGWDFELGAGWMGRGGRLDGPGLLAEGAIYRKFGTISDSGFVGDLSLGARYQQGFGAAGDFRAVLVSIRGGLGWDQPLPEVPVDDVPGFSYTTGLRLALGVPFSAPGPLEPGSLFGFGGHFGVPLGAWFELRARGEFLSRSQGTKEKGDQTSMVSFTGAGVARLRFDRVAPLYLEAGAGYATNTGTPALYVPDAGFATFGAGGRLTWCGTDSALEIGAEGRIGLGDNRGLDAIFLVIGAEYAGGRRSIGRDSFGCRMTTRARERNEANARAAAERDAQLRAATRAGGSVGVGGSVGGSVGVSGGVGGSATVVVPAPVQPVRVEVLLGVSLFGGAVSVRVDPSMLPLARLAGAGRVEVRIEGPESALVTAEAQVRGVLDRDGKRLDAVVRVPTNSSQIRAIFTIWPPGAR